MRLLSHTFHFCAIFIFQTRPKVIDFTTPPPNNSTYEPRLFDKQTAISLFFKSCADNNGDPYYLKHVFPAFPGAVSPSPGLWRSHDRVDCPAGEGDDKYCGSLVDPLKYTLYVWNMIRKLGNSGTHTHSGSERWLQENFLRIALKELCNRSSRYYHRRHGKPAPEIMYNPNKFCYGTGQVVFSPSPDGRDWTRSPSGILPDFKEHLNPLNSCLQCRYNRPLNKLSCSGLSD